MSPCCYFPYVCFRYVGVGPVSFGYADNLLESCPRLVRSSSEAFARAEAASLQSSFHHLDENPGAFPFFFIVGRASRVERLYIASIRESMVSVFQLAARVGGDGGCEYVVPFLPFFCRDGHVKSVGSGLLCVAKAESGSKLWCV
jgi:hypothetical protein